MPLTQDTRVRVPVSEFYVVLLMDLWCCWERDGKHVRLGGAVIGAGGDPNEDDSKIFVSDHDTDPNPLHDKDMAKVVVVWENLQQVPILHNPR